MATMKQTITNLVIPTAEFGLSRPVAATVDLGSYQGDLTYTRVKFDHPNAETMGTRPIEIEIQGAFERQAFIATLEEVLETLRGQR